MAVAAEFPWRSNERHMEEYTNAAHILPACESNPVVVAVSSLAGMKSGSPCARLTWVRDARASSSGRFPRQPPALGVSHLARTAYPGRWPSIDVIGGISGGTLYPQIKNALTLVVVPDI